MNGRAWAWTTREQCSVFVVAIVAMVESVNPDGYCETNLHHVLVS
jgi:hypothetical protein